MSEFDRGLVHQACVYGSDDEFLAMAVPFVVDGLAREESVLAVTTRANIDLLQQALGADAGRVEVVDARDWYLYPASTLSAYDKYVARCPGYVRVIGEPVWPQGSDQLVTEWKRYESVLNVVFADSPAWIVCPYDTRTLDPAIVDDARRTHPAVVAGRVALRSPDFTDPAEYFGVCDTTPLPAPPATAAVLPFVRDLRGVRRFVAIQAERHGLRGDVVVLYTAAVSEAVAYLMDHGGERPVVRLWAELDDVVCDIRDHTARAAETFLGYRPPGQAARADDGLWLTRQVTDLTEVRSDDTGTTVRLHVSPQKAEHRTTRLRT